MISFSSAVAFHRNGHVARGVHEMKELVKQAHQAMEAYHRRLEEELRLRHADLAIMRYMYAKNDDPDAFHDVVKKMDGIEEALGELAASKSRER